MGRRLAKVFAAWLCSARLCSARLCIVLLATFSSGAVFAATSADGVVSGGLERWLNTEVLPPLKNLLSNHPRFKGETIRVAGLTDGRPHQVSDELTQAVASALTHGLLKEDGVRIAWREASASPCALPRALPYLLGIEVSRKGSRSFQVTVAMIDVDESVWVSGASYRYDGRLSAAQARAVKKPITTAAVGTVSSPAPLADHPAITAALAAQIGCRGIEGEVFIKSPEQAVLAPIVANLQQRIARRASLDVVTDLKSADWVLQLQLKRVVGAGHELVALLSANETEDASGASSEAETSRAQQRLAALFVEPTPAQLAQFAPVTASPRTPSEPSVARPSLPAAQTAVELIKSVKRSRPDAGGRCRTRRGRCVEVEVELNRPAYLVLFHTAADNTSADRLGAVSVERCERAFVDPKSGKTRYRVTTQSREAGIYVLATPHFAVAQQLQHQLAAGDANCQAVGGDASWLSATRELLDTVADRVDWQVLRVGSATTRPSPVVAQHRRVK